MFRVRTDPKIGRYTNDFLAELGQIFDRGTDDSVEFAIAVLNELGKRAPEYKAIIAKWLGCYKNRRGYNKIIESGGIDGIDLS